LIGEDVKNLKNKDILKKWLSIIEALENRKKQETVNDLIFKYQNEKRGEQIKCGFEKLNKHLFLQAGQLVTIGARPSIGKTWLMLQMAIDIAKNWKKVSFFNLEMDEKVVMDRMLSYLTNTDNTVFRYWSVDQNILNRGIAKLKELENNLFFENKKRITSSEIIQSIKSNKPDVVFIDYLWLLDDKLEKGQIKAYQIGEITRNLKIIAWEYNCLIVLASQLNRGLAKEKRPPVIDDLRDSGAIEQDSDVVLLLHRENRDEPETELIIGKNRNGFIWKTNMMMKLETTSFYEI
jgi:replicative DNA helicase